VLRLYQAACLLVAGHVAAHELEWDRALDRLITAGIGERPRDTLLAK
jgi:hypothetical protein